MNAWALVPLAAFIANEFCAAYIIARGQSNPINRAYLGFSAVVGLATFGGFLSWTFTQPQSTALILMRLSICAYFAIGPTFLYFVYVFIGRKPDWLLWTFVGFATLSISLASWSPLMVEDVIQRSWGVSPRLGPLFVIGIMSSFFAAITTSIVVLLRNLPAEGERRRAAILIVLGLSVPILASIVYDVVLGRVIGAERVVSLGVVGLMFNSVLVFVAITRFDFLSPTVQTVAEALFGQLEEGVLLLDDNGVIAVANEKAREIFEESDLAGRQVTDLLPTDETEVEVPSSNGTRHLLVTRGPQPGGELWILQDVTSDVEHEQEIDRLAAQLRQQQRLESVGLLASGVAHEINNPVHAILNFAQILAANSEGEMQGFASTIIEESQRVAQITRDLVAFSRRESGSTKQVQLAQILKSSLNLLNHALELERITIDQEDIADLPAVQGRPHQLQQVVMNLILNARDAIADSSNGESGGNRRIGISGEEFDNDGQPWIRLRFSDTGTGMTDEVLEKMFDPFFTTKSVEAGTGLGLSISYGIISDHGGQLLAESEPGEGSTLIIELPAVK